MHQPQTMNFRKESFCPAVFCGTSMRQLPAGMFFFRNFKRVIRNLEWWGLSRALMTLMEYQTGTGSEVEVRPYNGDTVGAWSGGYLRVLSELFPVRMMNSVYPENKRNPVRHISVALVCHRHLRDSPPLRVSHYAVGFLHHSLFRKDKKHSDRTTSKFAARNWNRE